MSINKEELLGKLESEFSASLYYEDWHLQSDHGERYTWLSNECHLVPYADRFRGRLSEIQKELKEDFDMSITENLEKEFSKMAEKIDNLDGKRATHFSIACDLDEEIDGLLDDIQNQIAKVIFEEAEML